MISFMLQQNELPLVFLALTGLSLLQTHMKKEMVLDLCLACIVFDEDLRSG